MEEQEKKEKTYETRLIEDTEQAICKILDDGISTSNLDYLGKLVDIHKDICNEEYWKIKEEVYMRDRRYRGEYGNENYGNYGNYGADSYGRRMRDSRGRYMARGRDAKYRGEEYMEDMNESYHDYQDGKESYGADESTMKSLKEMLTSVEKFMKHLEENAESEQEVSMIKQTAEKIARM